MAEGELAELWRWLREHQRMEHEHQSSINARLTNIEDTLSQAKGGWKVLVTMGTLVTAASAGVAWLWVNVLHGGVK
jgi:hypothetical protein